MIELRLNDQTFLCSDLERGEYVWVNSENFDVQKCGAYVQDLYDYRTFDPKAKPQTLVYVRLDLEDDHPAVRDARGDAEAELYAARAREGMTEAYIPPEEFEFMDHVLPKDIERQDGRRVRIWERPISSAERAARARQQRLSRIAFPDLDTGLRNSQTSRVPKRKKHYA